MEEVSTRIKHHFVRDIVKDGKLIIKFYKTGDEIADILTKSLKLGTFVKMKEKLGVKQI